MFSPLFGAYLHMKNWQALGEPALAQKSRNWVIGSLAFLLLVALSSLLLPDSKGVDALLRLAGLALLVSWHYAIGKSQYAFIVERYGKGYVRRGWAVPLLAALFGLFVFILLIASVVYVVQLLAGAVN